MKTPVGLLSGGQRQAVSLLMCTMTPPKLLLLDEHTAALDPATADKVLQITQEIVQKHRITTLMIIPQPAALAADGQQDADDERREDTVGSLRGAAGTDERAGAAGAFSAGGQLCAGQ